MVKRRDGRPAFQCGAIGAAWAAWLRVASAHLPQRQVHSMLLVGRREWQSWLAGTVPDAGTVCIIASILGAVQDEALLAAGYAPRSLPAQTLIEMMRVWHGRTWMHPALYLQVGRMLSLSIPRQAEMANLLAVYVDAHYLAEAGQRKREERKARAVERNRDAARKRYVPVPERSGRLQRPNGQ